MKRRPSKVKRLEIVSTSEKKSCIGDVPEAHQWNVNRPKFEIMSMVSFTCLNFETPHLSLSIC